MEGLKGNGVMERMYAQPGTKQDAKKAYANLLAELRRSVVDVGHIHGDLVLYTTEEKYPKIVELCKKAGIEPETVGEYIGRKDLHGDEIYEGNIVRDHSDPMGTGDVGVVVYNADRAMFAIRYYGGTDESITYGMYDCKQKELEVIGNIHDNPELLKRED